MSRAEVYAEHFFGVSLELRLLLGAIVLGAFLGALYDILRALRLSVRHGGAAVFFEDVGFTVVFFGAFYIFCTSLCRGELRFFVLAGMTAGFLIYLVTLGRIVVKLVGAAVEYVKKLFTILGRMLKKFAGILLGTPYFRKKDKNFRENPCQNSEYDV